MGLNKIAKGFTLEVWEMELMGSRKLCPSYIFLCHSTSYLCIKVTSILQSYFRFHLSFIYGYLQAVYHDAAGDVGTAELEDVKGCYGFTA